MAGSSTITEAPRGADRSAKVLGLILSVLVVCVIIFALVMRQGLKALARTDCGYNLRQISLPCREYAAGHDGKFPSTWAELNLVGENSNWAKLFRCPSTGHEVGTWTQVDLWSDYRLIPGRSTNDPPGTILAVEPLANHGSTGAHVLLVDGSTAWWSAWLLEQGSRAKRPSMPAATNKRMQ
jgi:hypothetical protein